MLIKLVRFEFCVMLRSWPLTEQLMKTPILTTWVSESDISASNLGDNVYKKQTAITIEQDPRTLTHLNNVVHQAG